VCRSISFPKSTLLLTLGILSAGTALPSPGLEAQDQTLVDRIAAVVGDSVIALSQIEERVFQIEAQGSEIPPRGSSEFVRLQRDILDQMIDEQLIVQAALRDTTIVLDDIELEGLVSD